VTRRRLGMRVVLETISHCQKETPTNSFFRKCGVPSVMQTTVIHHFFVNNFEVFEGRFHICFNFEAIKSLF